MRKLFGSVLIALFLFSTFSVLAPQVKAETDITQYPWAMFHHDSRHTGFSASPAPATNSTIWIFHASERVVSSPAVVNGKVFVSSMDGKVYAINQFNGILLWSSQLDYAGINFGSPAIQDNNLFITAWNKTYALDVETGAILWKSYTGDFSDLSSPNFGDGMVFVASFDGVHALNATTGELIWKYHDIVSSSVALANGIVFASSSHHADASRKIFALDQLTGNLLWSTDIEDGMAGSFISSPAVVDGKVFVGLIGGEDYKRGMVYALDEYSGSIIWRSIIIESIYSSPAVAYGKVFIGSYDGKIYAFNETNGNLIWSYTTAQGVGSSPSVAAGKVFIGSDDHFVYALDEETGDLIWRYKTGHRVESSPAVADGAVYVGSLDGKLYAFGPAPVDLPPTCVTKLQKDGVEINEIDVGQFFDIYVGDSSDDIGIEAVRFSSDDFQDGNPTGEWTDWYDWDTSLGDWNASTKIERWAFATGGAKEVWAEVKDDAGQTAKCSANINANETREMKIIRLITQEATGGVPVTVDGQYYIILTLKSYINPITLEVVPNVMTKVYVEVAENYPVSDPEIARKIGLIDYARGLQQGIGSPESIAQKSQYLIDEWLAYRDVEFEDEAVEIIGNWFSAIPGLGWLMDRITSEIKQLTWDPISELRDIANRDIQRALDLYVSAQRMATNEISDYDVAYTYLKNLWEGEVYQNIGTSLLYKINEVGKSKLERIKDYFVREIVTELLDLIFKAGELGIAEVVIDFIEMDLEAVDATSWADGYEREKSREMSNVELKLSQQLWGASGYTLELAQTPRIAAEVHSPVELRVYDSQGRVTGVVNGEEKNEIPYSTCYENTVTIFFPSDSYRYEVAGTDQGTYGLTVISITDGEATTFTTADIPTSANTIHQYTIDWFALSRGEEGVTVQIDSDGDGTFEQTIGANGELTHDEFVHAYLCMYTHVEKTFKPNEVSWRRRGSVMSWTRINNTGYIGLSEITFNDTILDGWTIKNLDRTISVTLFIDGAKYQIPYDELDYVAIENGRYTAYINFTAGVDLYQSNATSDMEEYRMTIYALEPGWVLEIKYPMHPPTDLPPGEYEAMVSVTIGSPERITVTVEDTATLYVK